MFERIDKEEDGEVYVREVVDFLRVLDNNLEQSEEVRIKCKFVIKMRFLKSCERGFGCIETGFCDTIL